jgi:CubicO group peptidase (beta-lactamase class C family)
MDFGILFGLTPRTAENAVGFRARAPGVYSYRVPLPRDDGWQVAAAADVGLDPARLTALVQSIIDVDATGDTAPLVHSVVVARRGKLVLEEYFFGSSPDLPHDLRSASKTFTGIMAGVASDQGRIDVTTRVWPLFPADSNINPDPRKATITLGQLLTHSSGLACDDNDDNSPGNENKTAQESQDYYHHTLDLPIARDPGTLYAYCSMGMNLAGGAIASATRSWLPEFFDRYLARPLGITHYHMNLMPDGQGYSGGGVKMLPRDLLKFGQLYLNGGVWNGQRLLSESWVRRSTENQSAGAGATDGYGWHRTTLKINGRDYQEYEANGNGGQFLIVVPELELAVVFTAGNYMQYPIWRRFRDVWVGQYLAP